MYKIIFLLLISIILILNLKYNTSENFDNNVSFLNKYKTDKWSQLGFNDKLKIYSKNLPVEYSNYVDKYKVKVKYYILWFLVLIIPKNCCHTPWNDL